MNFVVLLYEVRKPFFRLENKLHLYSQSFWEDVETG
jgi:hypothetical protein